MAGLLLLLLLLVSTISSSLTSGSKPLTRQLSQLEEGISYSPRLDREYQRRISSDQSQRISTNQKRISSNQKRISTNQKRISSDQKRISSDQKRISSDQRWISSSQRIRQDNTPPGYWLLAVVVKFLSYLVRTII